MAFGQFGEVEKMKKDKEWLKDKIKDEEDDLKYVYDNYVPYEKVLISDDVYYLIDQLDEPQKPVIPKFVADFIEKWKYKGLTMHEWFAFGNNDADDNVNKWLYNNLNEENRRREYLLIDAIRYGYEVEKEPYYCVAFEGEFNLLYVTHVDIYGENGKFNYSSEFDKSNALKFTDKSRAKYLADFLGAIVLEEKK